MPNRAAQQGFTLIELMVVIAIIGVVVRVVLLNMGAFVPATILDGEVKQMRAHLDFLRSEARLRSQWCALELDLTAHRYRYVLPPERRLASYEEEISELPLGWTPLDERVVFAGVAMPSRPLIERGIYRITFDENGSTGDLAIFLKLQDAQNEYMWTLQLRGLTGRTDIHKSVEGQRALLEEVNEAAF
jgi:prepilin-type N-terminal cleavage/methylation domain-containing protein